MKIGLELIVVALGGACGALFRHFVNCGAALVFKSDLPWGTLLSNVIGCFLIGLMIGSGHDQKYDVVRLGFGVGFLGSLTTFSTFSAETIKHAQNGQWMIAGANIGTNLTICLLSVVVGLVLAKKLFV